MNDPATTCYRLSIRKLPPANVPPGYPMYGVDQGTKYLVRTYRNGKVRTGGTSSFPASSEKDFMKFANEEREQFDAACRGIVTRARR